jgi:hypothetical protein
MARAGLLLSRQGPCGLPAVWGRQGRVDTATAQRREARAPTLPLPPGDGAQPAPDPLVEAAQHRWGLAEAEVVAPSEEVARQLFDDPHEVRALGAARQIADLRLEPGQGLRRDAPLGL